MRTYIKDEFEHDKNDAIKIKMINLYQSNDHTASLASCVRIENDHTTLLVIVAFPLQSDNREKVRNSYRSLGA